MPLSLARTSTSSSARIGCYGCRCTASCTPIPSILFLMVCPYPPPAIRFNCRKYSSDTTSSGTLKSSTASTSLPESLYIIVVGQYTAQIMQPPQLTIIGSPERTCVRDIGFRLNHIDWARVSSKHVFSKVFDWTAAFAQLLLAEEGREAMICLTL